MVDPIETARTLAAAHPDAHLPCPVCANPCANVAAHLAKVHPDARASRTWRGKDRRIVLTAGIATALGAAIAVGITLATPIPPHTTGALAVIAIVVVPAVIAFAGVLDVWSSKLVVDGDALVLRHSFGLGRRRVTLASALEVGPWFGSQIDPTMTSYADDTNVASRAVRRGSYLRIGNGRRVIAIAAKGMFPFEATWDAATWARGPRRRWCDIVVPRDVMVAIEYELAARGRLRPAAQA